ncbi:MAG TPA: AMP-binding protein [Polyangiaceae bacterium]|jgi:hypothetical protein|nr:AMP-binding protein [Polyangiaceae bacterium]
MSHETNGKVGDVPPVAQTLGQLHLEGERSRAARMVLRSRDDEKWVELPAWRFYRQVIRIALFLRERLGVAPGDRVLVASPLRTERIVAEWAIVTIGAATVAADLDLPQDALGSLVAAISPKAAFVADEADRGRLLGHPNSPIADRIVVFGAGGTRPESKTWLEALDLGGTLDTAERAQMFRQDARSIQPDLAAVGYHERANGAPITMLSHAEVVRRLRSFWSRVPPRDADRAYITGGQSVSPLCLPLWAFAADGRTSTTLGTVGREAEEIAQLRPHLHVLSPDLDSQIRRDGVLHPPHDEEPTTAARLLGRIPIVGRFSERLIARAAAGAGTRSETPDASSGLGTLLNRFLPRVVGAHAGDSLRGVLTFEGTDLQTEKRRFQ